MDTVNSVISMLLPAVICNRPFVILPNYRMINYDTIFNLSSGVTCNWCIQLDALQSLALTLQGSFFQHGNNSGRKYH